MKPEGRLTGASPEQIEAAWKRRKQRWIDEGLEELAKNEVVAKTLLGNTAIDLVDTDHRIVRVDDLRALIEHTVWRDDDHEGHAALSRIVDLIGEAE